jgi:hypothetical protein
MIYQRGQFVVLKGGKPWNGLIGCVMSISPKNKLCRVAVMPQPGEAMIMIVQVREDQLKDYQPKEV